MYSLSQIRKGIRWGFESPNLFLREANRLYYVARNGSGFNHKGIDVISKDWDTLIILDACRYDLFREEISISGKLKKQTSRAAHTSEFLRGNFDGRKLHDVVYTNASPQLAKRRNEIDVEFHCVTNVWNTDRWDDDEKTVPPEAMTAAALEAHETYPNKRHIIHYMQPHYPFIGSDIRTGTNWLNDQKEFDMWEQRIRGRIEISAEDIWTAYRQNLRMALRSVKSLLNDIDGRVVITSDHGNMIGERASPFPIREWGHPIGIYTEELVTVPWLELDAGPRREIVSESPAKTNEHIDDTLVTDRLRDLGYVE